MSQHAGSIVILEKVISPRVLKEKSGGGKPRPDRGEPFSFDDTRALFLPMLARRDLLLIHSTFLKIMFGSHIFHVNGFK